MTFSNEESFWITFQVRPPWNVTVIIQQNSDPVKIFDMIWLGDEKDEEKWSQKQLSDRIPVTHDSKILELVILFLEKLSKFPESLAYICWQ